MLCLGFSVKSLLQTRPPYKSLSLRYLSNLLLFRHQVSEPLSTLFDSQQTGLQDCPRLKARRFRLEQTRNIFWLGPPLTEMAVAMRSVKEGLTRFLLFEIRIEKPGRLIVKGSKLLRRCAPRISVVAFVKIGWVRSVQSSKLTA